MSKVARPAKAVFDIRSLKVGDRLWGVYGSWLNPIGAKVTVPIDSMPMVVTKPVHEFLFLDALAGAAKPSKLLVFKVRDAHGLVSMKFAADYNLIGDGAPSASNNFLFPDLKSAEAGAIAVMTALSANPKLVRRELSEEEIEKPSWPTARLSRRSTEERPATLIT